MTIKDPSAPTAPDPRDWVPMHQHKAVADELAALQAHQAREQADAAVQAAMRDGKLAPAMQAWAQGYAEKDPQGFAQWCAAAPALLSAHAATPTAQPAQAAGTLNDEDRYVCAALGVAETEFAAHKKTLIQE